MVANFSVATSESWNDRDTGERQEKQMAQSGLFWKIGGDS